MRIEGQTPGQTREVGGTDQVTGTARPVNEAVRRPEQDRVDLSANAELFTEAKRAAEGAPEVRTELVDKMRRALEAGELGNDTSHIADRMIDRLLEE